MGLQSEVGEYVAASEELLEGSPQMDESNTKRKIIEPLLELLGWRVVSADVELEYSVQIGVGTKKADYALLLEERPVVFVEAKGADTALTEKHETQLRSYMRQIGVDWGLLTNGREFRVFRRDTTTQTPNELLLASFDLEDAAANTLVLEALTKEAIAAGEDEPIAQQIEATLEAIAVLRDEKPTLATDITELVTAETGEAIAQPVEDAAKSFVDDLITTLESRSHIPETDPEPPQPKPGPEPDGRYQIVFSRAGDHVATVSADSQADVMTEGARYLVDHEALLDAVSLPYIPGTGRGSHALLNETPHHADGSEMRQANEVVDDVWVFTSLSATDKHRYFPELADVVGLDCQFEGDW
ncbi:type I restriction enzyme HsdR N-terminal domain-containing protein [Halorubellus sp. PRR65]|uniref:type I restriction enzyme HsdR N-terminal domain-containing protein n=1 Tax=Halorubellus sp. PRR65 TaxID=3098148 RepID=UPI002B264332|nr:type I restriction enzyme HsdR N-terminal domain-containing protein [Halorubellus sp. PRR65]